MLVRFLVMFSAATLSGFLWIGVGDFPPETKDLITRATKVWISLGYVLLALCLLKKLPKRAEGAFMLVLALAYITYAFEPSKFQYYF